MTYVLPLWGIGLADTGRVGRKAAVLGELLAAGFTVPAGFALTVDAQEASGGAGSGGGSAVVAPHSGHLSDELVDEVRRAWRALGGGPVAVRSSGVDEDLAAMSYAGQYESVLDVRGLDAVTAAVRTCWESASSERVVAYRAGDVGPVRMGVLVQEMVDAVAAGVAFSANPVTGDTTEVVISAVRGLGDRLVAGEVSADEWSVRHGVAARKSARGNGVPPAIDADQARTIAQLAERVAEYFQAPQDIEWAVADGTVWLLQARPITALPGMAVPPVPIEIEVPAGYSTRNRSMDRPWTPMERSVFLPVFSAAVRHILAYTTGVVPAVHAIGGWTYVTVRPDSAEALVARMERIAADLAEGRPVELIRRWHESWKPEVAADIVRLRGVDLAGLSDPGLRAHMGTLGAIFEQLHDRYFQLTGAAIAISGGLGATCAELFGWPAEQSARLRGGLTGDHMAATIRLSELAQLAASRPSVRGILEQSEVDTDLLAKVDPEFSAGFTDYVNSYAHRTIGFDITEPTLAEQPGVLLALIREQIARPYDFAAERAAIEARKAQAVEQARAALVGRPATDRARFEAALSAIGLASPVRDEKVFYAVSLWALLRYATLELGRRLVDRGAADRPDDVFFLELVEALAALSSGTDQRDRVRRHRGQHAWALANPGPPDYGEPSPPVVLDPGWPLSPGARRALQTAKSSMRLMGGASPAPNADGHLHGLAASPGRYIGPVRVIRTVTEFAKLRYGDVLVCPETTAQWSMLFPSVGALVTDRGSLLSHPAIIAREYGVPAVVATGTATSTLHDDQLVIVDGTTGEVRPAVGALA